MHAVQANTSVCCMGSVRGESKVFLVATLSTRARRPGAHGAAACKRRHSSPCTVASRPFGDGRLEIVHGSLLGTQAV
jgi:hypothetical protein